MNYVPQSYEEWEHCITVKCGIPLTPDYVAGRIAALENSRDFHTEKFITRWGAAHHARILEWSREAQPDRLGRDEVHQPADRAITVPVAGRLAADVVDGAAHRNNHLLHLLRLARNTVREARCRQADGKDQDGQQPRDTIQVRGQAPSARPAVPEGRSPVA